MWLVQVARCEQCKRPLHRLQYTKFSQVVMAATLRTMAQVAASRRASLELQLRREATGALRFCDPQQVGAHSCAHAWAGQAAGATLGRNA